MNCLKCPNYWRTDIDETMCECCGMTAIDEQKESEVEPNEQMR